MTRLLVTKLEEKFPVPSIGAEWVTPFRVIDTLPVGIKAPDLIVPPRFVVLVPGEMLGAIRLLNIGANLEIIKVPVELPV